MTHRKRLVLTAALLASPAAALATGFRLPDQDAFATARGEAFAATADNPAADGNANALFDAADFVAWRKNLGASVHAGAGAGVSPAVPEPTATVLALASLVVGLLYLGRQHRTTSS